MIRTSYFACAFLTAVLSTGAACAQLPGPVPYDSVLVSPHCMPYIWQPNSHYLAPLPDLPGRGYPAIPQAPRDSGLAFTDVLIYDFYSSLSLVAYTNSQTADQHNEIDFYYNFTVNNSLKIGKFNLRTYLYNDYGFRGFYDSINTKNQDKYTIKNTFIYPLTKKIRLQVSQNVSSQLWNTYRYRPDSLGNQEKYLYTAYFSPGYIMYGGGLSFSFPKNATLDVGLASSRITRIRNTRIFEARGSDNLYGIEKDKHRKVDYGIDLHLNVPPRLITKHFGWESTIDCYASKDNIGDIKGYTLDAMNAIYYLCLRNLRFSLKTIAIYDKTVSEKIFISNTLTFGFYLSNEL